MTAQLKGQDKYEYVQDMFGRIAGTYDLMNFLMTAGQDRAWRKFVIKQARIAPGDTVLDIASGTGDIAFEALRTSPDVAAVGADFSLPMMHVGQKRPLGGRVQWAGADAMNLPFETATFNAVTAGYLLRNVPDIPRTLTEIHRVLEPGGRFVVLDSAPPPPGPIKPLIEFHLRYVIPTAGRLISGQGDAYEYLPESTQAFKTPEELAKLMIDAKFEKVSFRTFVFGTMAVHWGEKPLTEGG
ncbi:MAG: ubiquinone/menaquinone biosynthesis methyltransferase [Chloroflexota bacterium]